MILIPHGKKIALIATSLFVTTLSLVFFFVGGSEGHQNLQANIFAEFFHKGGAFVSYMEKDAPVAALDLSGSVIEVNEKFTLTLGYQSRDVVMKNFFSLLSAEDLPAFAADFSSVSTSGKVLVHSGPYHLMASDGKEHVVLATFDLVRQEGGSGKMMVVTLKDITESLEKDKNIKSGSGSTGGSTGKPIKDLEGEKDEDENRIIVEKTV